MLRPSQFLGTPTDEEIALKLARMIIETPRRPFFEYRDFISGGTSSLVPAREEAQYFRALIRALRGAGGLSSIAFLIDEFEEIALQKRLTKKAAHDYLATLKRLIDLASDEDFWVIVSMTPHAMEVTRELEDALVQRLAGVFAIPPLSGTDTAMLLQERLGGARPTGYQGTSPLFPFPDDMAAALQPVTISSPRRMVKLAFWAIATWLVEDDNVTLPFSRDYIGRIESNLYQSEPKTS